MTGTMAQMLQQGKNENSSLSQFFISSSSKCTGQCKQNVNAAEDFIQIWKVANRTLLLQRVMLLLQPLSSVYKALQHNYQEVI